MPAAFRSAAIALKTEPYWWQAAPREAAAAQPATIPKSADVAIVGAGYAGLSAALALARAGRSVVVLDAETPGFGGSSRSGGMIGHGHRLSYAALLHTGLLAVATAFDDIAFKAVPLYDGTPWFLPLMTGYYRAKDLWRGD